MPDSGALYELNPSLGDVPEGLHLVAGLTGFADAGAAVTQLSAHLLGTLSHTVVATFDADVLLDYRARRPTVYFDQDHLTDYSAPVLKLYLARDELHQPFLLLTGFEPDFRWEAFASSVLGLIDRFAVKSVTWVHAIPMPVPHTRPIGVTVSGNRQELIDRMSVWRPHTQVPANALHLIEYRLQQQGSPVAAFVLLVPHYLSDTEYPAAAVRALESVSAATGLIFPTETLRGEDREFIANIDSQVAANAELGKLVGALEERHDSYMEDSPLNSPLADVDGSLPSADEIAAELENFLAFRRHGDDEGGQTR
ncbi:PAC2 family protein [Microbacterium sp. STN6]|uniref:proteasome assembly chaperone family protein n=1 Tax=Microbacterium sp. STN6 TaxID=2995588 RepID=UPI002260C676|nr:PAC2 family protein [Microbacterium sp. STN6]MCX7522428.1 PAC2 family protein [Microbacterium sp. STN6]